MSSFKKQKKVHLRWFNKMNNLKEKVIKPALAQATDKVVGDHFIWAEIKSS